MPAQVGPNQLNSALQAANSCNAESEAHQAAGGEGRGLGGAEPGALQAASSEDRRRRMRVAAAHAAAHCAAAAPACLVLLVVLWMRPAARTSKFTLRGIRFFSCVPQCGSGGVLHWNWHVYTCSYATRRILPVVW